MSKEIKDWGFGVIETRETFYTQEPIDKFKHKIADLQHRLDVAEKALNEMADDWCLIDNPNKPSDVVKKYKERAKHELKEAKND